MTQVVAAATVAEARAAVVVAVVAVVEANRQSSVHSHCPQDSLGTVFIFTCYWISVCMIK